MMRVILDEASAEPGERVTRRVRLISRAPKWAWIETTPSGRILRRGTCDGDDLPIPVMFASPLHLGPVEAGWVDWPLPTEDAAENREGSEG